MLENIYTIFIIAIAVILVIFMAYYVTLFMAKKSNVYFQGRSVKVLERTVISNSFSIVFIQVMDKVHILAVQNKNMLVLDTVELTAWHEYKKLHGGTNHHENIIDLINKSSIAMKIKLNSLTSKSKPKGDENNK